MDEPLEIESFGNFPNQYRSDEDNKEDSESTCCIEDLTEPEVYDIGVCVEKRAFLKPEEIFKFLTETQVPDSNYKFPLSEEQGQNRIFNVCWLQRFKWLAYSFKANGVFCKYCVLFSCEHAGLNSNQILKTFVTVPLRKYKKAIKEMSRHNDLQYHRFSEEKALEFIKNFVSSRSVEVLIDKGKQQLIEKNRKKLIPIINTILFCCQNNLPLRGHRDFGSIKTQEQIRRSLSGQEGIFRSLLAFRLDSGDDVLKDHLETAPGNCSWISNRIQNEIIYVIGSYIRSEIVKRIKKSKLYSIICDETTDASTKEQLSINIRYIDMDELVIREDFLGFIAMASTTGVAIKDAISSELAKLDLPISHLRGQGYDGGSNMSGSETGVQALILKEQPLAFYTHCFSHSLNLCVAKASEVQEIRNMLGTVSDICSFFNRFAKRVLILKAKIEHLAPEQKKEGLKNLCSTRWIEKHECVKTFCELISYVAKALEDLKYDRDLNTSAKATQLFCAMTQSEFLISLFVVNSINQPLIPLSRALQKPELQISSACNHISQLIELLTQYRQDDEYFSCIYKEAFDVAGEIGVEIKTPRICSRQKYRCNIQTNDPGTYYRVSIYYPYFDFLISQLKDRFRGKFLGVLPLESLIPAFYAKNSLDEIITAAFIYENDLNGCSESELRFEIKLWHRYCMEEEYSEIVTATETLQIIHSKGFELFLPNVTILLQLLATLPVTSATAERSFSVLKRLKTYLRTTMTENRLNGLALGNIHKDLNIKTADIVDLFCKAKPRRILTLDWSKDE